MVLVGVVVDVGVSVTVGVTVGVLVCVGVGVDDTQGDDALTNAVPLPLSVTV